MRLLNRCSAQRSLRNARRESAGRLRSWPHHAAVWIWVVLSVCLPAGLDAADAPLRPNIVFILADDLGYGDLGCYGQQRIETPRLDAMAKQGLRFTDFYAGATVCAPSRCVLMTGRHTGRAHVRGNGGLSLRPEDVTVADMLKSAGYATGLIGKWGLGREGSTGVPTKQGFDYFYGYLDQGHAHNYYPPFLIRGEERVPLGNVVPGGEESGKGIATKRVDYSHDLLAEEALAFIDRHRNETFFLYLALTIPHANNEAREKGMEVPDYGIYANLDWPEPQKGHAAMITRMDADVGRLLDRLKEHGIDDRTLVIFTSDNGPHREGGNDPEFNRSSGPLRGIKRDLYEGGIRVPCIARWPGMIKPNSESNLAADFADFLPTAAELAGVELAVETDGVSLVPTLLGSAGRQAIRPYLYWEFYERGSAQAVRFGPWKAVRQPMFDGKVELYNLDNDLGETRDLAARQPDLLARAVAMMQEAHTPSENWRVSSRAPRQR